MRICLLHVCAYISHMDINIQANEQEPTLAVKTKKSNDIPLHLSTIAWDMEIVGDF